MVGEPVTLELAEQAEVGGGAQDLLAHERRSVADHQDIQVRGEAGEPGFGRRVPGQRAPGAAVQAEGTKDELRSRLQPGDVGWVDVGPEDLLAAREPDLR